MISTAVTPTGQAAEPQAPAPTPKRLSLREGLKALVRAVALVLVSPLLVSYWLRALVLGRDRALMGSSQTLSLLPGLLGQYLRRAFYGRVLAHCHPTATIEFGVLFSKADARIEENVYIGPRSHIGLVDIGRESLLGAGVHVTSGSQTHGFGDLGLPLREQPGTTVRVRIGAGAWVGSAAVVMADVGRDTIVGAGAVVTKPLPDRVIAAGVPARIIRNRPAELEDRGSRIEN
jgi:virginiamycin A acetyltransferase